MTDAKKYNLPADVTLDSSVADAAARAEEYTIVRRGKLGVGHFFRDSSRVKSKHLLPWFWHRYTPDGDDSGWAENKNECVYRILKAAASESPKTPPLVAFAEQLIREALNTCVREPTAERRLIAECIIKQAFAAVGTPGLRADWKSMLAGIGIGGLATYAAMRPEPK